MTRQAAWKEEHPAVPLPSETKAAVKAYAQAEGLKLYRAVDKLLRSAEQLKPYLEQKI